MTLQTGVQEQSRAGLPAAAPEVGFRYVARQPILDLQSRIFGYELLFRSGPESFFSGDGDLATRTMLDNTVIFGLEHLTGGTSAFVNCTREALTEPLVDILPPSLTVLEVLEDLEPTPELVAACRKLKASGFRIALDDFIWKPELEPLVELADYIKIDFTLSGPDDRRWMIQRMAPRGITMLAEKVETQQEYEQARKEGFTLFQGYYFCRPVLMKSRKVPANRLSQIEILQMLREEQIDLKKMAKLVQRDASLTYRLLRLVNSPICAVRREIRSVETALMVVGEDTFRRIATLAITSEMGSGQPPELLHMTFIRARFCELAAPKSSLDPTEQYLLGMLSLLPAMLRVPMEQLAPDLPLRNEIRLALQGAGVPEQKLLDWVLETEQGHWEACEQIAQQLGIENDVLADCYAQALQWAEGAMRFS